MGAQILRQPDGLLAVFSTVTDTFTLADATVDEVVDHFVEMAAERTGRHARSQAEAVAAGRNPYPSNAPIRTWAEAVESDRQHGGEFSAECSCYFQPQVITATTTTDADWQWDPDCPVHRTDPAENW